MSKERVNHSPNKPKTVVVSPTVSSAGRLFQSSNIKQNVTNSADFGNSQITKGGQQILIDDPAFLAVSEEAPSIH